MIEASTSDTNSFWDTMPFKTQLHSSSPDNRVWQGTDVYSLPLLRMDVYNESSAGTKARSLAFNWNFQNGEVVRALVNTADKSAVVQGSNEYLFNSAAGTASVRIYDSAGQVLYYDIDTLNGTKMKDLSGNAHDGTIYGSPGASPAEWGNGRTFDAATKYINAGDIKGIWSGFTVVATFSITAWPSNWGDVVAKDTTVA